MQDLRAKADSGGTATRSNDPRAKGLITPGALERICFFFGGVTSMASEGVLTPLAARSYIRFGPWDLYLTVTLTLSNVISLNKQTRKTNKATIRGAQPAQRLPRESSGAYPGPRARIRTLRRGFGRKCIDCGDLNEADIGVWC